MDPLSAAASAFAVVSLALQLTNTVRDIRNFLNGISDGPKEYERLVELLEQLDLVIDGVRSLLERQKIQNRDLAPAPAPAVLRALQGCQNALEPLSILVQEAKCAFRKPGVLSKTRASLKLTWKKNDVTIFEEQLQRAMTTLQTTLTLNLTHMK